MTENINSLANFKDLYEIYRYLRAQTIYYLYIINLRFSEVWFLIQNILDTAPRAKKGEPIKHYIDRLEQRHALRFINLQMQYCPRFDVDGLERELNTNILTKANREKLEQWKAIGEHRQMLQLFKDNILQN